MKERTFKCQSCGHPVHYKDEHCPNCHCVDPGYLRTLANHTVVGAVIIVLFAALLSILLGHFVLYPWTYSWMDHDAVVATGCTFLNCFALFILLFTLLFFLYKRYFLDRLFEKYREFILKTNGDDPESMANWVQKAMSNISLY